MGVVAKVLGTLVLVVGIVTLLAGLGTAGYAAMDQQDNEEESGPLGIAEDRERSDTNEQMMAGGLVAGAVGLVLTLVGIVVLVASGPRQARAAQPPSDVPPAQPTHADGGSTGPLRGRQVALAAGLLVAVLAVVLFVVAGSPGQDGGLLGSLGGNSGGGGSGRLVDEQSAEGTVPASITILGSSQAVDSTSFEFDAPDDTGRTEVILSWEAAVGGAQSLQFRVQAYELDGSWTEIGNEQGPSVLHYNITADYPAGAHLRYQVFPGEDGAVQAQDYSLTLRFWTA